RVASPNSGDSMDNIPLRRRRPAFGSMDEPEEDEIVSSQPTAPFPSNSPPKHSSTKKSSKNLSSTTFSHSWFKPDKIGQPLGWTFIRPSSSDRYDQPPRDCYPFFEVQFKLGLRFPLNRDVVRICEWLSLPLHQLPPNAILAQFRDYHAEKFSGQGDPRIVDEWIQGLEFIFEVMECPDRYRVVCAQLQLTGDARLWLNAYWSMRPGEKTGCTWDMFKELVRDKYYPSYYRAEMERQFLALQERSGSLTDFTQQFVTTSWDTGLRPTLVPFLSPRRWTLVSGGRQFVIVPSHPPQLSHLQLHQLYQPHSQQRRRRGRERAHRLTGGPDRDSSRFHRARLVVDFTGESVVLDWTSATIARGRDILRVA
ncbi:Unknown protein, partial [Striga hermonthica]